MSKCIPVTPSWWVSHIPVGVLVAVLGVVAGVVPFVWERAGKLSSEYARHLIKGMLIVIMCALAAGELHTIYLDHKQNQLEHAYADCEQAERFDGIARKIEENITNSNDRFDGIAKKIESNIQNEKKHFDKSMQASEALLQGVQDDRQAITGEKSFPVVIGFQKGGPRDETEFKLVLIVAGKYPMKNLSLSIRRADLPDLQQRIKKDGFEKALESTPLPIDQTQLNPGIHDLSGTYFVTNGLYQIDSFSQSGHYTEMLQIKGIGAFKGNGPRGIIQTYDIYRNGQHFTESNEVGERQFFHPACEAIFVSCP